MSATEQAAARGRGVESAHARAGLASGLGSDSGWSSPCSSSLWIGFIGRRAWRSGRRSTIPKDFLIVMLNGDHRGRALLRRCERLHADLRPDARRQHGARLVLPARRLHRAQCSARPRRAGRRLRPVVEPGQRRQLGRAGDRRHRARGVRRPCDAADSCCAGTRDRICVRRSSRSRSRSSSPIRCSRTSAASPRASPGRARIDHFVDLRVAGVQYSEERLLILLLSLVIGGVALALAEADADGDGDPRGRRRSRDGERARHQHPA